MLNNSSDALNSLFRGGLFYRRFPDTPPKNVKSRHVIHTTTACPLKHTNFPADINTRAAMHLQ
jgi:hypothetical protein